MMKTFFDLNMPYGIRRNQRNEWCAFNRYYRPLGVPAGEWLPDELYAALFTGVEFPGLTEQLTQRIANGRIERDETGRVVAFWLYSNATDPRKGPVHMTDYLERLAQLFKLQMA